jgi:hypothetical protein
MKVLEKLDAIEEIKRLKARYFRGVDCKDRSLLRDVFVDEVEVDFRNAATDPETGISFAPAAPCILRDGDAVTDIIMVAMANVVSVHHASLPEIEVTGPTTARGIFPMVDRIRFPASEPLAEMIGYGYYFDTFERKDGWWRIKTLRLARTRVDAIPRAIIPAAVPRA